MTDDAPAPPRYSLTPTQIVEIYRAGISRGSDEASAFEWGSRCTGQTLEQLEDCLVWSNDCGLTADLDYQEKKDWWAAFCKELEQAMVRAQGDTP